MNVPAEPQTPRRLDLLRASPRLGRLLRQRWFPLVIAFPLLMLTATFVTAGLLGTPVGNSNGLVIFVWILWWFILMAVLVPLASRSWCGVCPVPLLGDWLQRRRVVGVAHADPQTGDRTGLIGRNRYRGLSRRWPQKLSNLWLQNAGFLLLATFSVALLTSPLAGALAVGGMVVAATATALVYRQRSFCRFLCPVGGFLSLYAMSSTMAVRPRSSAVCQSCREKNCVAGSAQGWGCPWLIHPGGLQRNNACGLCLECFKTCAQGNMTIFLRPPFAERRLADWDEAFKAFLMLALAVAYSAVYQGPWGWLKAAANVAEVAEWRIFGLYAAGLWIFTLVIVPGLHVGASWLGRALAKSPADVSLRAAALAGASSLVPLGLLAWIAFSVPLVLANGSYVLMVASDPFGWGWDLFGSATVGWRPVVPHWGSWIQAGLVLVGQTAGLKAGWLETRAVYGTDRQAVVGYAPTALLVTIFTLVLLALYAG